MAIRKFLPCVCYIVQSQNGDDINLLPRELKIAVHLIQGFSRERIANESRVAIRTVDYYVQQLKLKFQLNDEAMLISKLKKINVVKQLVEMT